MNILAKNNIAVQEIRSTVRRALHANGILKPGDSKVCTLTIPGMGNIKITVTTPDMLIGDNKLDAFLAQPVGELLKYFPDVKRVVTLISNTVPTIGYLLRQDESDVLTIPRIGIGYVEKIREIFERLGLTLGGNYPAGPFETESAKTLTSEWLTRTRGSTYSSFKLNAIWVRCVVSKMTKTSLLQELRGIDQVRSHRFLEIVLRNLRLLGLSLKE